MLLKPFVTKKWKIWSNYQHIILLIFNTTIKTTIMIKSFKILFYTLSNRLYNCFPIELLAILNKNLIYCNLNFQSTLNYIFLCIQLSNVNIVYPIQGSYEDKRCKCVCPSPAAVLNNTVGSDRKLYIGNVPPNKWLV